MHSNSNPLAVAGIHYFSMQDLLQAESGMLPIAKQPLES